MLSICAKMRPDMTSTTKSHLTDRSRRSKRVELFRQPEEKIKTQIHQKSYLSQCLKWYGARRGKHLVGNLPPLPLARAGLNPRPTEGYFESPSRFLAIASIPMELSPPNLQYPLFQQFYTFCSNIKVQGIIVRIQMTSESRHVSPISTKNKGLRESPPRIGTV